MTTAPPEKLPIIGRELGLITHLTKLVGDAAGRKHETTNPHDTLDRRGFSFRVRLFDEDGPTGRVARVTVELEGIDHELAADTALRPHHLARRFPGS
jgi:hypothetical protein